MHKRARRPGLPGGLPARPARAVRGRLLARRAARRRRARARSPTRSIPRARTAAPRVRDSLLQLGAAFPERRPGSAGDAALADRVGEVFRAAGFQVSTHARRRGARSTARPSSRRSSASGPGCSSRRIVVLAHRDALDSPGLAELSGTAALLELARIFRTRVPSDGGGRRRARAAAARRAATCARRSCSSRRPAGAAAARARARGRARRTPGRSTACSCSATSRRRRGTSRGSCRGPTAARSRRSAGSARSRRRCARRSARDPGGSRASAQWARRALPLTVSEQGEVNRAGLPGVLLQISGERGPAARRARLARALHRDRAARRCARSSRSTRRAGARRRRDAAAVRRRAGRHRHAAQRAAGLERAAARALPAAARRCSRRSTRSSARAGTGCTRARGSRWALAAGVAVPLAWAWLRVLGIAGALPAPRGPVLPADLPLDVRPGRGARLGRARAGGRRRARARLLALPAARGARQPGGRRGRAPRSARSSAASRCSSGSSTRTPRRCCCRPRTCGCSSARRRRGCAARGAGSRSPPGCSRRRSCSSPRWTRCGSARSSWRGMWLVATRRRARLGLVGAGGRRARAAAWPRSCASCCARRRIAAAAPPTTSARARAGRRRTPGRARSAAPSRRCGADIARRALRALSTVLIVAGALAARRRRRDAAVGGAGHRASTRACSRSGSTTSSRRSSGRRRRRPSGACWRGCPTPRRAARLRGARAGAPQRGRRPARPAARARDRARRGRRPGHGRAASCAPGPGHYPDTPLPGQRGTVAIAGHRTTYGAPFRRVDDLERGDRIELRDAVRPLHLPRRAHAHRARRPRRGSSRRVAYDRLVLTACHPLYSAAERIVVFARLDQRSGEDPMAERSDPCRCCSCDADGDSDISSGTAARGRFGREVPAPATDDVQMADARTTMQSDRGDERFETAGYEVDADAVADAIVAAGCSPAARWRRRRRGAPRVDPDRRPDARRRTSAMSGRAPGFARAGLALVLEAAPGAGAARAPRHSTPGGPAATSPIQVSGAAASAAARSAGRDADAQLEVLAAGRRQLGRVAAERVRDLGDAGRQRQRRRVEREPHAARPPPAGARPRPARRRGRASRARPPRRARGPRPAAACGRR